MEFGFRCSEGGHQFENGVREATHAEQLGLDSVWTAEHHGWETFWPSSHIALAAIAARTNELRLGTGITLLTQANPVRLAGEANLVDVISNGRFVLGVGLGWHRPEMENLGYDFESRGPRMTDHLRAMNALWGRDETSYEGPFVEVENFSLSPEPVQDPRPPVVVGGSSTPALKRAAYLGDGWFPAWLADIETLSGQYETYDRFRRESGSDERMRPLLRLTYVHEDRAVALRRVRETFQALVEGYSGQDTDDGAFLTEDQRRHLEEDFEAFAERRFIFGTPEEVVEDIDSYRRELGIDHLVFKLANPGVSHDEVMRQLELLGDRVLPRVRG